MNKEQKSAVVEEIARQISESEAVFAVDYRGISVPQAAEVRARLRDADTTFRVVKNTLTDRAADKAGAEPLREVLEGPTAFAFVHGDAAVAAKAISDFARASGLMPFKGGVMEGRALTIEELQAIARLPARDLLHAQMVGIVASPLTGLVRGLGGLLGGLAIALEQVREQKEGEEPPGGQAPEAEGEAPEAEGEQAPDGGEEEQTETSTSDEGGDEAQAEDAAEDKE